MAPKISYISLNASQDAFILGTDAGIRIFNCNPLVELRNFGISKFGSVKLCKMLDRTNLIAIVGGGLHPKFANNAVLIWDDLAKKFCLEITVSGPVLNVILTHTKLAVVQCCRICIFSFPKPCTLLTTEDTRDNPRALCQLSLDTGCEFLVYPGFKIGSVQLVNLRNNVRDCSVAPVTINAHQSELQLIVLNNQGTLLATGSEKGTVVRVFDTRTRLLMCEFRRGSDPATLQCLRFSPCSSYLCVSSDKGTVHIFAVRDKLYWRQFGPFTILNATSFPNFRLQQVGLAGGNETRRNLTQFSPCSTGGPDECAFVGPGGRNVITLYRDGAYYRFQFTQDGRSIPVGFDYFLDLGDEQVFWTVDRD